VLAEGLFPRCSPDGEWVLFKSEDGLRKVPIKGGEPILLSTFLVRYLISLRMANTLPASITPVTPAHGSSLSSPPRAADL